MTDKSVSVSSGGDSLQSSGKSSGESSLQAGKAPKKAGVKSILKGLFGGNGELRLRDKVGEILDEIDDQDRPQSRLGNGAREILENIVKAGNFTAEDVMVPRADIDSIEDTTPLADVTSMMVEMPHSRYPIYRDTPDQITGMVHIKDVFRLLKEKSETGKIDADFSLSSIRREVMFVAPSIRVLDLLVEMRESRHHMALIVDEYGGVDGLITIEDLVEEIVGDIVDEHDQEEIPQSTLMPDGSYAVEARFEVEDFEAQVGKFLSAEERAQDIDTIGGFIFNLLGRVPARGELIRHSESGLEFEVTDADPRRIKHMRVRGVKKRGSENRDSEKTGSEKPEPGKSSKKKSATKKRAE